MGERILSFFFVFNIFFFPSDTPSQLIVCVLLMHGADVAAKDVRSERVCESASHRRRDVWGFVWFTDGCLFGCGVWPHMQWRVRFTYLISLLCSLSFSLTHPFHHTHPLLTHIHPLTHTHTPAHSHTTTHSNTHFTHPYTLRIRLKWLCFLKFLTIFHY